MMIMDPWMMLASTSDCTRQSHTDQGPAFHNELVQELYACVENGIVERANQEVLRALLFDSRVHDKWSFEQLPLVQRIMNTVRRHRQESLQRI